MRTYGVGVVLVGDVPLDDDAAAARRHFREFAAQKATDVWLTDACKMHLLISMWFTCVRVGSRILTKVHVFILTESLGIYLYKFCLNQIVKGFQLH